MTQSSRDVLRRVFILDYEVLKTRLTHRLGSTDLASDALQDTWLSLERATPAGPIQWPGQYLFRVAYHIALKRLRREQQTVTLDEACAALGLVDDAPSAARIAEARSDLERLRLAVEELTPRRRDILIASRLEGTQLTTIADRYGISQRQVERELKQALLHCAERLGRKVVQRFGPRPSDRVADEPNE